MQPFQLTILGNNSAVPSYGRNPSAQVLQMGNDYFLIDCGEGTQMQLNKFEISRSRINHIFISHLHGDHFFGLIGLLNTYSLLRREKPLYIFCHQPLQSIIDTQLQASGAVLSFKVYYHFFTTKNELIFENKKLTVETILLSHRIDCVGFLFKEKIGERKIIKSQTDKYNVPTLQMKGIKAGEDFMDAKGICISNTLLTEPADATRSYAYISDTCFLTDLPAQINGVDLLYHEATFKNEDTQRATDTFHCTASQAATIAKLSNVKKMLLGHYSAKYKTDQLNELLLQAKAIFEESYLSEEGEVIEII